MSDPDLFFYRRVGDIEIADTPRDRQRDRVWAALREGQWWTLEELARRTGDPEASISARIRDLRKTYMIHKERLPSGLWRYRAT